MIPSTSYVRSGDADIAYKVCGEGERDLLISFSFASNIDALFELSENVEFIERMMRFGRVILFDKRGTGLSERTTDLVSIEQRSDDVIAVLDAAGSKSAALLGYGDGAAVCLATAARHHDRVESVIAGEVLVVGHRDKEFPWGVRAKFTGPVMRALVSAGWGNGQVMKILAPSWTADRRLFEWWMRYERLATTPSGASRLLEEIVDIDIRPYLPHVRVPVLVVHDVDMKMLPTAAFRWLADQLSDGRLTLIQDSSTPIFIPGDAFVDEVEEFLIGTRTGGRREIATLVVTDVVGSTDSLAQSGDAAWRDRLVAHRESVRHSLARYSGREVDTAGDGFFLSFPLPSLALRFAEEAVTDASRLGIGLRVGVHIGEVLVRDADVIGIAAHIAARVEAAAIPGAVFVTDAVRMLVLGSRMRFEPAGEFSLKGVPGTWPLFRLVVGVDPGTSV
ncbi:adenylate/guanylate cyclase domain-containing protein [Agromyces bracchium]|uniref:Adenylate/guanylate cyclase domain-containing protein n=1 Tax=Agromyces bracchium TaxID=88376 RepID=A0A6I3M8Y8_9MICO|nr:adenylate/guanylate cyclase domain-containing protein [Agromyces bracchium]MTH68582.1 adenylate/guanylate cyclase domain-containing protein [Agromyces bracchium]